MLHIQLTVLSFSNKPLLTLKFKYETSNIDFFNDKIMDWKGQLVCQKSVSETFCGNIKQDKLFFFKKKRLFFLSDGMSDKA